MVKPTIGGRVPQDLKEEFDEFAEEHDLSQTDALRRLLRAGLEAENEPDRPAAGGGGQGFVERLASIKTIGVALALQIVALGLWTSAALLPGGAFVEALILVLAGTVALTLATLTV